MPAYVSDIWVYLSANPLLWLTATMVAYVIGHWIFVRCGQNPLLNPVATAVVLLIGVLWATGTDYRSYFDGAQFVHFMLGPAVVALGVPLYEHLAEVRKTLVPMACALLAGVVTAIISVVAIAMILGASNETWPRSRRSRSRLRSPWASRARSAACRR